MTKQEMAQWLAEKVLGWKWEGDYGQGITGSGVPDSWGGWRNKDGFLIESIPGLIDEHIYSPDGMDAVWDAVDKRRGDGWSTIFKAYENGNFICTFEFRMNPICMGKGKTRREAFYNAVYQVRKENK